MASAQETGGGADMYGYAPDNKRIYKAHNNGAWFEEVTFYGVKGNKLGVWQLQTSNSYRISFVPLGTSVSFAGKLIWETLREGPSTRTGWGRTGRAARAFIRTGMRSPRPAMTGRSSPPITEIPTRRWITQISASTPQPTAGSIPPTGIRPAEDQVTREAGI